MSSYFTSEKLVEKGPEEAFDNFDLEQAILSCWNVVGDLQMVLKENQLNEDLISSIATLYELKFDHAWRIYEQLCSTGRFK